MKVVGKADQASLLAYFVILARWAGRSYTKVVGKANQASLFVYFAVLSRWIGMRDYYEGQRRDGILIAAIRSGEGRKQRTDHKPEEVP